MNGAAKKLHLIETILKVEDEAVLNELEQVITKAAPRLNKISAFNFVGTLSKEDAELMEKAIEEGCEQINPDDWK